MADGASALTRSGARFPAPSWLPSWLRPRWRTGRGGRPERHGPIVRRRPSWGAVLGAWAGYSLSLTPSLLPRAWWLQGLCAAVSAAIGYALGAAVQAVARRCGARPGPRTVRWAWWILGAVVLVGTVLVTARSVHWQGEVRRAVALPPQLPWWQWVLVPLVAVAVGGLLVLLARSLRLGARALARVLRRVAPAPVAYAAGAALVAVVVVGVVQGFLLSGVLSAIESGASLADRGTSPGIVRPDLPTLSGSPVSYESWDSLGNQGRNFVGQASTRDELTRFAGRPAMDPVRVYVGLRSADTLPKRAALAVAELERTGGFSRKVLAVMGTTGSGWINPQASAPLEYMYAGDSAEVGLQYSYLPSVASVLTEDEAAKAGAALFDAVRAKWLTLPAATRPKLVVFGESLGSYATERAFDGDPSRLGTEADGALLVGPTFDNPLWLEVTRDREPGSPQWRPVVDRGARFRFAQVPADLGVPATPWPGPRTVYLQNGSDPIVWWSPGLLFHRPDWLDRPRAADVSPAMNWYPVLTFWQVACDLADANGVPHGHGHRYGTMPTTAWAAIVPPPGWTSADTERLAARLTGLGQG
ncbi:alpha/beta hydrolase [Streptacidiphilus cavernicola]|uniref:Alpha/beta hydrolase n=1 Tax=Streptacidiphilus cavernicola TaxID=3342716 RepID=A0ABV6VV68_9ACTN